MTTYEFDCACCKAHRERWAKGRQRYRYHWNGQCFDDMAAWAAAAGMRLTTLKKRLECGFCLRASLGAVGRSHRQSWLSVEYPCAALAAQFCRVMAQTMRA